MNRSLEPVFSVDIGVIHFIGIGGIGMSGIAEILHNMGYKVQGSDASDSYVTQRLEKNGIKVFKEHVAVNIKQASLVVKSTAIKDNNPEIIAAKELNIPIIKRAEMLAELMRFKHSIAISGTHGKTTTTSLVAKLFETAGTNPTVINGGIINQHGTNAYLGSGDYLIAEADESDGTFIKVPSYVAVVTNIDPEHMDYYGTFDKVKDAYRTFITNLPFYGFGVMCFDHPVVREIGSAINDRKVISYGIDSADVDFRAVNIIPTEKGSTFDVEMSARYVKSKNLKSNKISGITIGIHGRHNVANSLSAIAIGVEKGFDQELIKTAFENFGGVKRRFTTTGVVNGVTIVDDYAHHPVEIKATLSTARHIANLRDSNVIAVMQPHRYSRLNDLMDEFSNAFADANHVFIADVYSAGEAPIANVSAEVLVEKIKSCGQNNVAKLESPDMLAQIINNLAKSNDLVVFLGAGNITKWAYDLPKQIEELKKAA
jgi:UDP-N-acetylmuramate--alanine ligase